MRTRSAAERLQRRSRIRRLLLWAAAITAIVIAVMLIRCGGGFGFGTGGGLGLGAGKGRGLGSNVGTGSGTRRARAPQPCAVRVDAAGITVDGRSATVPDVVTACRAAGGAEVVVVGDARLGTWEALRVALDTAAIATHVRGAGELPADGGPALAGDAGP